MIRSAPFRTATTALALLPATWAQADVTAQDVWQNMRTTAGIFGGNLAARLEKTNTGLHASIVTYRMSLTTPPSTYGQAPTHIADIEITLPDLSLTESGNGTVQIHHDLSAPYVATLTGPDGETITLSTSLQAKNGNITASGRRDRIAYDYGAERFQIQAGPLKIQGADGFEMKMSFDYANLTGQSVIDTSDGLRITSTSSNSANTYTSEDREPIGSDQVKITSSNGTAIAVSANSELVLPKGKIDLLNLSHSLRNGMRLSANMTADGYNEVVNTTMNGATSWLVSHWDTTLGSQELTLDLDQAGVDLALAINDLDIDVTAPSFPLLMIGPIEIDARTLDFRLALPLLKDEAEADNFRFLLGLDDLETGKDVWSALDANDALPRTPVALKFDMSATMKNNIEWLDVLNLEAALDAMPGAYSQPLDVSLNTFRLDALGTTASAEGALTFDHSDTETVEGMPRPEGGFTVDVQGANALLDALIKADLLPEDQAMGVRLLLAGFSKPVGEDHLTSTIEMTPEGQILANGQRLK